MSEDGARVAMIQMKVKIARLSREEDGEKKREEKLGEGVAAATVLHWGFSFLVLEKGELLLAPPTWVFFNHIPKIPL